MKLQMTNMHTSHHGFVPIRILQPNKTMKPTLHHLIVNNNVYRDLNNNYCMWQTIAVSIKAMYILLGKSNLSSWQAPISSNKLLEMIISYSLHILGIFVSTQRMDIKILPKFISDRILWSKWWPHLKAFLLQDIESLTWKLGHIASTTPWLQFLILDLYAMIAQCLCLHNNNLSIANKQICALLKIQIS